MSFCGFKLSHNGKRSVPTSLPRGTDDDIIAEQLYLYYSRVRLPRHTRQLRQPMTVSGLMAATFCDGDRNLCSTLFRTAIRHKGLSCQITKTVSATGNSSVNHQLFSIGAALSFRILIKNRSQRQSQRFTLNTIILADCLPRTVCYGSRPLQMTSV